jgi:hypothetical protein
MTTDLFYVLLLIVSLAVSLSCPNEVYIKWDENKHNYVISDSKVSDPVAWASVENAINKTG